MDIRLEFLGAEDGVDGGHAEGASNEMTAQLEETVHRRGSRLHHQLQGDPGSEQFLALKLPQMVGHQRGQVVADDDNLLGIIVKKDTEKAVDERLTIHLYQGFGQSDSFCSQAAALACGNNGIFHDGIYFNNDMS